MPPSLATVTGPPRVAIIGGGLTGLTAAWRLQKAGVTVQVFERALMPWAAALGRSAVMV